ncbi:MAG: hypothetical protein AAGD08_12330 [Pseudomonadota bacterium]
MRPLLAFAALAVAGWVAGCSTDWEDEAAAGSGPEAAAATTPAEATDRPTFQAVEELETTAGSEASGGSGAAAAAAAPQVAAAESAAPAAPAEAEAPVRVTPAQASGPAFDLSSCREEADRRLHARIGGAVFALPAEKILRLVPAGGAAGQGAVAPGDGCPDRPVGVDVVLIGDALDAPSLLGPMGLRNVAPRDRGFAEVVTGLQQEQPAEACKPAGEGLIQCFGTERNGERVTPVLYLISTRGDQRLAMGAPLTARCIIDAESQSIRGCGVLDMAGDGVMFEASLAPGTYTTETLQAALETAAVYVESLRAG